MADSRPFQAWAIAGVLLVLVLPLIAVLGLIALGTDDETLLRELNRIVSGELGVVAIALAIVWALLVAVALFALIPYVLRSRPRA